MLQIERLMPPPLDVRQRHPALDQRQIGTVKRA